MHNWGVVGVFFHIYYKFYITTIFKSGKNHPLCRGKKIMKRTKTHVLYRGRFVVGVAICLLLLTTSIATAFVHPFTNGQTLTSKTQLSYSWAFPAPSFQSISADDSTYTMVNIPGCISGGMEVGAPQLPMEMIQLLLPPKTTVSGLHYSLIDVMTLSVK